MSAINEQILVDQIDATKSELASCQKSLEGSAANRSNPPEWYKERIEHLNEKLAEYQELLEDGDFSSFSTEKNESDSPDIEFIALSNEVQQLKLDVASFRFSLELLESNFGACKLRLEAVEAAAKKPVDPNPVINTNPAPGQEITVV